MMQRPKEFLSKFRMSMLKASKKLEDEPASLVVTEMGVLVDGERMPTEEEKKQWTVKVDRKWNMEHLVEEKDRMRKYTRKSGLQQAASQDGVFVEYKIEGSKAKEIEAEVNGAVEEAAQGKGPLTDNADGQSLVVKPVAEGNTALTNSSPPSDASSSSSQTWLYGLLGGVGALCMGSAIALTVYTKRRQPTSGMQQLLEDVEQPLAPTKDSTPDVECGNI
eukprot:TRINITY_DN657_c0_g1_i1.p1 TRINITY_DN657_c0_g1~~TRINITY_DN657_c0_g1_i1.p1  ORF type:complete len:220 (+),score=74.98 TRINITY_DN657_c0_g1_i1:218-877(+)